MSAITVWTDESAVVHNVKSYWIIGQLITNSDGEELEFLRKRRVAHKDARTGGTLHACEFDESHDRKWALLLRWINIFLKDDRVFFHSFVFERSAEWEPRYSSPHDYFAHQILFGLPNRMKPQGSEM